MTFPGSKATTNTFSLSKAPSKDVTTASTAEDKPDRLSKLIDSASVAPSSKQQPNEALEKSAPKPLSNHLKVNTMESQPKSGKKDPIKATSGPTQSTPTAVSKATEGN